MHTFHLLKKDLQDRLKSEVDDYFEKIWRDAESKIETFVADLQENLSTQLAEDLERIAAGVIELTQIELSQTPIEPDKIKLEIQVVLVRRSERCLSKAKVK